MNLMPTPRDTLLVDGPAQLYHFRRDVPKVSAPPVLLVPSMINRWYVLDLREGSSLATALAKAGLDVYCLDWGTFHDEDRYFSWKDAIDRIARMMRRVIRESGQPKVTVLGYCMGATLTAVHAAIEPELYAGVVNLLGPIDFSKAGMLGTMTDPRWFDGDAVADAGNVAAQQMQSAFTLLRPTQNLAKAVGLIDKGHDPKFREAYEALEAWAGDNVAFPGEAYRVYIDELYQKNLLVKGEHAVGGKRANLAKITCPVLTVAAQKDTICPPQAAIAFNHHVSSQSKQVLEVPGGHVGAVVGSKAAQQLYPALIDWMRERTCN